MTVTAEPRSAYAGQMDVPRLELEIELTVASQLSDQSRQVLVAEVERIWRRERVLLRWLVHGAANAPLRTPPLRVLVVPKPASAANRWAVGELVQLTDARAMAIASIDGARRVVTEAERLRRVDPLAYEYRLGLVLGRAVAHEIGHYLLDTGTHSTRGLMRPGFDAGEFADIRAAGTFMLDGEASRLVRERAAANRSRIPKAMRGAAAQPLDLPARRSSYPGFTSPSP